SDGGYEDFRINADGTGVVQLTNSSSNFFVSSDPHIDDAGVWVAFASTANLDGSHPNNVYDVWRERSDGTGLPAITTGVTGDFSDYVNISADGSQICFSSNKDLTGGNPDRSIELFLWTSGTFRQITSTTVGYSGYCAFSHNGQWLYFMSYQPIFEANPTVMGE